MEYFRYIVRFLYRIRWYLVIIPLIALVLAWLLTRHLEKDYTVKTTVYTGIISGYNIETGSSVSATNSAVNMANLIHIISTERTLKEVSLRLFARVMTYGDENQNNKADCKGKNGRQQISFPVAESLTVIDKRGDKLRGDCTANAVGGHNNTGVFADILIEPAAYYQTGHSATSQSNTKTPKDTAKVVMPDIEGEISYNNGATQGKQTNAHQFFDAKALDHCTKVQTHDNLDNVANTCADVVSTTLNAQCFGNSTGVQTGVTAAKAQTDEFHHEAHEEYDPLVIKLSLFGCQSHCKHFLF